MFCSRCGKELSEDSQFCRSCGAPALPPGPAPGDASGQFLEAPKRRIGTPLLVTIIVFAVVVVGAAVAGPLVISNMSARQASQRKACQSNQRNVEAAIMEYAVTSPDETYPSLLQNLAGPGMDLLKSIPTCPSGDKPYIWVEGEIGVPPHISCPNNSSHTL